LLPSLGALLGLFLHELCTKRRRRPFTRLTLRCRKAGTLKECVFHSAFKPGLLDDVSELVREQSPPARRAGPILSACKDEVSPNCIRYRVNRPCRLCRFRIGVHAHVAEVMPEAWLHKRARGCIQWLPLRA
jgi:hypothetical protein